MQLIRTSFNLRSNMPWDELYQDCIYEWIGSSRDERGKRYYEHLFRKLPRQIERIISEIRVICGKKDNSHCNIEYEGF